MTTKAKRILLIAASIILLVFCVLQLISFLVTQKLPEVLNNKSENYVIDFKDVDVSLFSKSVSVHEIKVKSLDETKTGVFADVKAFKITGVSFYELIFKNRLSLHKLTLEQANTIVKHKKTDKTKQDKPLKKFLEEVFVRITVENVEIKQSRISFYAEQDSLPLMEVKEFSLNFEQIVLDTLTAQKKLPFSVASVNGVIHKATFKMDSLYNLKFSKLEFLGQAISVDSLSITTDLSKAEFQHKMPIQKDWIHFVAPNLTVANYNWKTDSSEVYFGADKITVQNMSLVAYRDKNHPFGPHTQKPMPSEMIRSIPFNIQIDSVQVKKGSIQYLEKPEGKTQKGQVDFDNVYATIYNITNDSVKLAKNSWMMLDAQCVFNHCGNLETHWEFKVPDYKDHFRVSGKLGAMDLTCVNQTFKPMLDVTVSGKVHQVKFDFSGDVANSKGELYFDYEDLQVQFLNEEKDMKNWLKNTLGNVVLRSNNLPSQAVYQKGPIEFKREQHKSIFNYLWKSVQSGLMPIVLPFKGEKVEK